MFVFKKSFLKWNKAYVKIKIDIHKIHYVSYYNVNNTLYNASEFKEIKLFAYELVLNKRPEMLLSFLIINGHRDMLYMKVKSMTHPLGR